MTDFLRTRRRFALGTAAAVAAAGVSSRRASAADNFTMRMSLPTPMTTAWNVSAAHLAQNIDKRSNGRLKIEVYPSGQLAKEAESINGLMSGTVDMTFQAAVFLEPLFPKVQVFGLPFLFKDAPTAIRVLDGPIGAEMFADFEKKGIIGLFWGFTGFRELLTTTKLIKTPEDVKGLRWRIQGGAVNVGMAQAVGAIPVTVDLSELYTALSQKTIDAVDSTPESVMNLKMYTVVQHMAITNHQFSTQPLLISKKSYDALPPDLQKILRDEVRAIVPSWRALTISRGNESIAGLKEKGLASNDVDHAAFRKAMDPVYAMLQSKLGGDLIDRVSKAAGA